MQEVLEHFLASWLLHCAKAPPYVSCWPRLLNLKPCSITSTHFSSLWLKLTLVCLHYSHFLTLASSVAMFHLTTRRTLAACLKKSNVPLATNVAKTLIPKATASTLAASSFFSNKNSVTSAPALGATSWHQFQRFKSVSASSMSDKEVNDLFLLWNDALATLDPDTVAKRYAKNAILLPTVSDTPRMDYDSIKAYFVDFLQKKPQGVLLESKVIKGDDWALDAGIYEFTMGATGDKVKARYTYLYNYEDGEWKIAHHHSSVMPEAFL